jgi:hypothetical protein
MITFQNEKMPDFECKKCTFICSKKSNYEKHLTTAKHLLSAANDNNDNAFCSEKMPKMPKIYDCLCGKTYTQKSNLSRHKRTCSAFNDHQEIKTLPQQKTDHLVELIKQNNDFKNLIMEQQKVITELSKNDRTQIIHNNTTNNTTHITNKFNMQFFLNEQCKDALNIHDFVESLQLSINDLENIGSNGFIEGISKIFLNGLQKLDVYKRPIHCSDVKRLIMYVKDQDEWEKEKKDNDKIKQAIKAIAHKNIKQIPEWKDANPQCADSSSIKNDQYLHIVSESMGGYNKEEDDENYNKIIKNVAKTVVIDKMDAST